MSAEYAKKLNKTQKHLYTLLNVTLDHISSNKDQFSEIEIHTSSESWISFPLIYGLLWEDNIWPRYNYLNIWNLRVQINLNT